MILIGRRNTLSVVRETPQGFYMDGQELGEILLPRRYVPQKCKPGDRLDTFVYLDSEDRLVATTEEPLAEVGEVACLRVVNVNREIGAFLDWGLAKDLLLPFREQVRSVRAGEMVVVAIYVDERTKRIAASMRLQKHLSRQTPDYKIGQPVTFLIAGETPLGYTAVVEQSHLGLLYRNAVATAPQIGQTMRGFVRALRPGGKIDLSLDAAGYKRVAPLTEMIMAALERSGGSLPYDDDSPPEKIREMFGVSKKAFKQALGALYKSRQIEFLKPGIKLLEKS